MAYFRGPGVSLVFLFVFPFRPVPLLAYRPGGITLYAIGCATKIVLMAVAWILAGDWIKSPTNYPSTALTFLGIAGIPSPGVLIAGMRQILVGATTAFFKSEPNPFLAPGSDKLGSAQKLLGCRLVIK